MSIDELADLTDVGEVHLPGTPGYEEHSAPWNVAVELRPAAVALPRTTEEAAAFVRQATAAGLRVAPQTTGHGAGPLAGRDLRDVALVKLSGLTGVRVDPVRRTAHVMGGTRWREVIDAAAAHGLTPAHGSSDSVGVVGYVLSGGLSFYGRRHGLAVNHVRAAEVVVADGSVVRATPEEHAGLFWGIRGGSANLGVVVALEIDLLPYADVHAGMLLWDRERASEVLRAWVEWTRTVPESVTTALRVMSFPPLPELPPFLSGRDVVVVDGAVLETDERARELFAPLRDLDPEVDTFSRIPASELPAVHMDPPGPTPVVTEHSILGEVGEEAIAALLRQVGPGTRSPVAFAELRHLGGAIERPAPGGGALTSVPGSYALYVAAVASTPEAAAAGRDAVRAVERSVARWSLPVMLPTFTDNRVDTSRFFDGEDWAALNHVRDDYGHGVFEANHAL